DALQHWILEPGYESPPRYSVTFRGAATRYRSAADWHKAAKSRLWREGSQYIEARCSKKKGFPRSKKGFRGLVQALLHKIETVPEQQPFRGVSLVLCGDVPFGALFVPDLVEGERLKAHERARGMQLKVTEYWLMTERYTPPPRGTFTLGSAE